MSLTGVMSPAQVVHCPAKPWKVSCDAEKDEESPVSPSIESPEQVTHCLQKT